MRNNLKINLIITIVLSALIILPGLVSAASPVLLSDQGTEARDKSTGELLSSGNLTITIYDAATDGNLIFNQNFTDAIVNGSWNIIMSPTLEFGEIYWKDYAINGQDLDFDGSERLNFQSPLGLINNVSFINFSLINSCPEGSSIRLIYDNGSVVCETDDSGSGSTDLTNYALKNQSETFSGNITSTQTGFFGFLGSLMTRVTKLFVQDIDVGNNINVSKNMTASYFIGDGSKLTNLPSGTESDPAWNGNYSIFTGLINNASYLSTYNVTYAGCVNNASYLSTYNATYAAGIGNISWNQSYANTLYAPISATGGNASWNESLAHTLFDSTYNASYSTFNSTLNIQMLFNTTASMIANLTFVRNFTTATIGSFYNGTASMIANLSISQNGLVNNASYLSTYNSTYAANTGNASWNQTLASTLYTSNATASMIANLSISQYGLVNNASYLSTYNSTYASNTDNASWNQSFAATLYAPISVTGGNASWNQSFANGLYISSGNLTLYNGLINNASYLSTYNATYAASVGNASWNQSFANTLYTSNATASMIANLTFVQNFTGANIGKFYNTTASQIANLTFTQNFTTANIGAFYNTTASMIANLSISQNGLINNASYLSTYNATYAASTGNVSWNESYAHSLFDSTYNATYNSFISNVSKNWTLDVYNAWNTAWLSTYNITYEGCINNASYLSTYNATYATNTDNSSWNQSFANTLYAGISWNYNQTTGAITILGTNITSINNSKAMVGNCTAGQVVQNSTINGVQCITPTAVETDPTWNGNYSIFTGLINNASYLSTYNATYAASVANNSWNESYAHTLFDSTYNASYSTFNSTLNIQMLFNTTASMIANLTFVRNFTTATIGSFYNGTASMIANLSIGQNGLINNASYLSTYNATYAASTGNASWNQSFADTLYAPISGGADNASWNESLAHTLFDSTYNATYAGYATNVSINYTLQTYNVWNTAWLSTYNLTYEGCINNASYLSTYNATYTGYSTFNKSSLLSNLTDSDCAAGTLVIGIQANGTVLCADDLQGGGASGNYFDQQLNTTSNVTFANITISTLNSASCDVKSTTSGNLYCGTDATESGGSALPLMYDEFTYWTTARTNGAGICAALSSGTAATVAGDGYIGVVSFSDSTTANGGYQCRTDAGALYFLGGEKYTIRFKPNTNVATTVIEMGFSDSSTAADPTDGCWLKSSDLVVTGYCKNNAGPTATGTTYTLSAGTWYIGEVEMNAGATQATFRIKNAGGSSTLWTDTVSSNIPTTSARAFGARLASWQSTTSAAAILVYWDYVKIEDS